jgi:hypothetical protein
MPRELSQWHNEFGCLLKGKIYFAPSFSLDPLSIKTLLLKYRPEKISS